MAINAIRALLSSRRRSWRDKATAIAVQWRWPELRVTAPCIWTVDEIDSLEFGIHVQIGPFSEIVVAGLSRYSTEAGSLRIGNRTVIGSSANIRAAGGRISIGDDCLIAQHVSLVASNHTIRAGATYHQLPWDITKKGVTIQDNVWIGCGATILPGCTIGSGAVIAAGSVVNRSVPPGTIFGGVPAKHLKDIV